ncbi:MAG TPA: OmpA family protein [Terracidiphilus sp.]|jgi:chemotaxis protein MotB|nr:OmpA family protein [Terracidiphilus sp.]
MRRRRRRGQAHEESVSHERWLISYADFVTLLFAFFVVLFATTYRDNQSIRSLSRAIHNGFQTMGAFSQDGPPSNAEYDQSPEKLQTDELSLKKSPPGSVADMQALRKQLEAALGKELRNHEVVLQVTPEGFTISLKELGFFASGQAKLLPGAADKLKRIAKVLSRPGLEIRVEGHSDNQPIHNDEFRSNWELSASRAMNVLLLLVDDAGFDPRNISAAGFGEYRPVSDNSTPDGRKMNRRVDLVVVQARETNAGSQAMKTASATTHN